MDDIDAGARAPLSRRTLLAGSALAAGSLALGPTRALGARPSAHDLAPVSRVVPQRIYGDDAFPVRYRRLMPIDAPMARYPGFKPSVRLLKKGTLRREGAMPLPCDIVFERDVPVKLRDGTTIYTDVFRPAVPGRYPAVMGWSPYGKEIGGQWLDDVPGRSGVPLAAVSELQRFEGPDPARFCARGYAVVSPDARGAYMSEGNVTFWGRQLAEDGHDVIEWAAAQHWCDGKVAMAGNSWLAISQWFIGAERPPHLAALAPWEGATDHYPTGGIIDTTFSDVIVQSFAGRNLVEDLPRMSLENSLRSPYWEDKVARVEKIDVPTYVVASYTHPAHTVGSFHGFRTIASERKWLRIHDTNEWCDFADEAHQADLLRFFDHVMKGADNGWDKTPRVRLAVLNPGGEDILNRPEPAFPLARQRPTPLYLAGDGLLAPTAPTESGRLAYSAIDGHVSFELAVPEDMEIVGYIKVRLWLEAEGADDMDVLVTIEKRAPDGGLLRGNPQTTLGSSISAKGMLRVSLRELDADRSTPSEPVLKRTPAQPLRPGEIVPVDIAVAPMGLLIQKGCRLRLNVVAAQPMPAFHWGFGEARIPVPRDGGTFAPGSKPDLVLLGGSPQDRPAFVAAQAVASPPSPNRGTHVVHFGGRYDSHMLVPLIPA